MKSAVFSSTILLILGLVTSAHANASAVEITVPENAKAGSTITIHLKVIHNANNIFHFTDWAWIKVNGKDLVRWDFTWSHRPEDKIFYRDVTYTVQGPIVVSAKSNCNLHGSAGGKSATVNVK